MTDHQNQTDLFGAAIICTSPKDPTTSGLEEMEDNVYVRYCKKHYALVDKLAEIGLPQPGQQIRLVTRRSFNAIQFIEYIAARETIVDIKMAIYSINYNAATILLKLINQ